MEKETTVNGLKISYIDQGSGDIILMLHGWGANKEAFMPLIKGLSKSFRVIVPDLFGFGKSDEPNEAWSVGDYAKAIDFFIKELEIKDAIWIGHSFGGRIIIKLFKDATYKPKKIVLIDSAGIKPKRTIKYYFKVYSYKIAKRILSLSIFKNTGLYEKLKKNAGSEDYKNASEIMKRTMSLAVNEDLKKYLPLIDRSTLLIWGNEDTATPIGDARIMEKLIPDAGLVVFEGAGHFSYLENPDRSVRIIEYFAKN